MPDTCIFTIVSKNYLGLAQVLMQSVSEHAPGVGRVVLLCEREVHETSPDFEILSVQELDIKHLEDMAIRYTQVELLTAIKPFVFRFLQEKNYKNVIYFDPDIYLYGSVNLIVSKLLESDILLTPHHITDINTDIPGLNREVLSSGIYNLGFLALKNSRNTMEMLGQWGDYLTENCVIDKANGRFLDQKWMDGVPETYENVEVVMDPGWNVAYWNIAEREITQSLSKFAVNGSPLFFFHFSGIRPRERIFSAHTNALKLNQLNAATRRIVLEYMKRTEGRVDHYDSRTRFSYSEFDGNYVPDIAKTVFRKYLEESNEQGNGHQDFSYHSMMKVLNAPVTPDGRKNPLLTRLAYAIYCRDSELERLFPGIPAENVSSFCRYFITRIKRDYRLSDDFTDSVRNSLHESWSGILSIQLALWESIFYIYDHSRFVRAVVLKLTSPAMRNRVIRIFTG